MNIHDIKLDTTVMGDEIRHTVRDSITQHISGTIIRTQDEQTKIALKKLGWLSPEEAKRVVVVVKALHNEIGRSTNIGLDIINLIEANQP